MMSMMTRRTVLPFLLALAVLALAAALIYGSTPVAAQSGGTLAAPTVELFAASACNPKNPRTYLAVTYTGVDDAKSYEYRVKWGRAESLGKWRAVPADKRPDAPWPVYTNRFVAPGETYVVQVRAVGSNGDKGATGAGRYSYQVGGLTAPDQVQGAYSVDGDDVDYTRARLTWRGSSESGGWYAVRQRAVGGKWQSEGWRKFPQVAGDDSPYYLDLSGLDPARGYQFRVAGHTAQCEASPWSDAAALWPTLSATSSDDVHEADGRWRHQSEDGPVSFKITWKGATMVRWSDWVSGDVEVADWEVTATSTDGTVRTKDAGTGAQRIVSFGNLAIGQDHTVVVKGLDADGDQVGAAQTVVIRSRHVSPPEAIAGLALSVGDDGLSVNASWTAPEDGGTPKRYTVYLTNLDTGRTRWQNVDARHRGGGWQLPKTEAAFDGLWPGDTYRVSVQTRNRNSRSKRSDIYREGWQGSTWTSATVTVPAGNDPAYEKKAPALIWFGYKGGEPTPPYVLGEPTAYVVFDDAVPGGRSWFDFPNNCLDYLNHYDRINTNVSEPEPALVAAHRARVQAWLQVRKIDEQRGYRDEAVAEKEQYLRDTPEGARDAAKIAGFDLKIARHQGNIDVGKLKLAGMERTVAARCAVAFPAVENLTEADDRFYRIAQVREQVGSRR